MLPFREKEEGKKEGFLRFPRPFAEGGNVRQKDGGVGKSASPPKLYSFAHYSGSHPRLWCSLFPRENSSSIIDKLYIFARICASFGLPHFYTKTLFVLLKNEYFGFSKTCTIEQSEFQDTHTS